MKRALLHLLFFVFTLVTFISCRTSPDTAVTRQPTPAVTVEVAPIPPTSTPPQTLEPGKQLTICMADEPTTLYWHGRETIYDEAVLHGLYENDLTTLSFAYQPQGLETIPSLATGDAAFRVVPVNAGDNVVDAAGNVVALAPGVAVINADGELVTFDGNTVLMQQLVVDFAMKQRYWADGQPVTAADSVYSFRLAAHPETPTDKFKIARTANYQATGNLSVRWAGLPGFRDDSYQTNFYRPLPQHAWRGLTEAELVTAEESSRLPLGDGPFRIIEWLPGERIRLEPNPYYYRAGEGLPRLDGVTFQFITDKNQRIAQLLAGNCQLITHEELDQELIPFFIEAQESELLNAFIRPGRTRWQVIFGINSAPDYGDGDGRPDWFEDIRVRQAIAHCTNRQQIVDTAISGYSFIPDSFVHIAHPLYAQNIRSWPFNPIVGNNLLDEVNLLDTNSDGIREDPSSGADFRISLITSQDQTERAVARALKESLIACGIDLLIESLPDPIRYAQGEENQISSRRFDLALTSTATDHIPACDQFATWQISGPEDEQNPFSGQPYAGWQGQNHSGWSNPDYDAACNSALDTIHGTVDHARYHEQAQVIFAENLPVLPLYFNPRTTATAPTIPYINNNASQSSELWNLFAIDVVR